MNRGFELPCTIFRRSIDAGRWARQMIMKKALVPLKFFTNPSCSSLYPPRALGNNRSKKQQKYPCKQDFNIMKGLGFYPQAAAALNTGSSSSVFVPMMAVDD